MSAAAPPAAAAKRGRAPADDVPVFVASGSSSDEEAGHGRPRGGEASMSLGNVVAAPRRRSDADGAAPPAARRRVDGGAANAAPSPPVLAPPRHALPRPVGGHLPRPGAGDGGGGGDKPSVMEGGKGGSQWVASGGATGSFPADPRVTLLFDLNGVLLVNPRTASGARVACLRPHTGEALARLAAHFRLGVYSSATTPTVMKALATVAAAVGWEGSGAGAGPSSAKGGGGGGGAAAAVAPSKLFELILCRKYCRPAPTSHVASGGKVWDTVKPLALHFGGPEALGRVVLVDNDAHKALPDEAGNMVLVPTWEGPPQAAAPSAGPPTDPDRVLLHLVEALLDPATGLAAPPGVDVRTRTAGVAARVAAAAAVEAAAAAAGGEAGVVAARTAVKAAQAAPIPSAPTPVPTKPPATTSGGAAGTPGVATPPREGGLPDERSAWATAVALAVHELASSASASLASIFAYARFRAPGAGVQVCLTKQAVKESVAALRAGGEEGGGAALVAATKPADARLIGGKQLKACFSLGPGARLPEGGVTAAVEALRAAVAALGLKPGKAPPTRKRKNKKGGGGGSGLGDAVYAALDDVVLASVADLTANGRAPNIATVLKSLEDAYGRPAFANAAAARSQLLSRLEEELRVETVSFGPRTPVAVSGLRCLAVPTPAEVDTALMMLLEYKRRSKQPSLPITGTLASDDDDDESGDELSVEQAANNIVAFPVQVPAQAAPGPAAASMDMAAPLPIYEDRGGGVGGAPGPQGGDIAENTSAPVPAPHSLTGPQGGGGASAPPHTGLEHAPPTLAGRPLGANWWEAAAGPGQHRNVGGPPPPHPLPPPVSAPPGPAFTDLHHEIVAFARRASPSQSEARVVQDAVSAIRRLATALWPTSQTILFGSQATGLALPGSDLDIVILGASDELENPASGFTWDQRHALGDRLRALLKAMRKANLVAGKAVVIKARVPIIKCDLRSGVAVDVSLGAANGAAAVGFIQRQVSLVPALRPLILVVKAVLKEAGLNEVFSGGLSSYSTTLMVMAHLQADGVAPPPTPASEGEGEGEGEGGGAAAPAPPPLTHDLGRLLWSFFHRFGRRFDYARDAVRVNAGGLAPKPSAWALPERPFALAVEDPQEAGKDIGSGSYNIAAVQVCFRRAADKLAAAVGSGSAGPSGGGGGAPSAGPRRGGAPIEFRPPAGGGSGRWGPHEADEAAAWAAIQADAANRSAHGHGRPPRPATPLNAIMDVEAAAARPAPGGGGGGGGARASPARGGRAATARDAALHHTRGGRPAPPAPRGGGGGGGRWAEQPFHRRSLANQVAAATTPGPLFGGGGGGGKGGGKWAKARAARHAAGGGGGGGGVHKPPPRKGRR